MLQGLPSPLGFYSANLPEPSVWKTAAPGKLRASKYDFLFPLNCNLVILSTCGPLCVYSHRRAALRLELYGLACSGMWSRANSLSFVPYYPVSSQAISNYPSSDCYLCISCGLDV